MHKYFITFFSLILSFFIIPTASAQDSYSPQMTISDGKDGRVWQQWKQGIKNQPIAVITANVQKLQGASDTFVNLRFGSGNAFNNGKQHFLNDTQAKTVSWNMSGTRSNGSELVMNAYKGNVKINWVKIKYQNQRISQVINTRPPHQGRPRNPVRGIGGGSFNNGSINNGSLSESQVLRRCRNQRVRRPRIEVDRVRSSGGLFSGKSRVNGNIFGACIEEAAYFENGRLRGALEFPFSDRFQRKEFSVQVRSGRNGQIRVYTVNGNEEVIHVDDLLRGNN